MKQKNKSKKYGLQIAGSHCQDNLFKIIFVTILLLTIFLRFYNLDTRVFHNDESRMAARAFWLFKDGFYIYDPVYHGPFIYYITAFIFSIFGDNEFSARLLPALSGVALVGVTYFFRKYIGNYGVLFAAGFFTFSPSFLYYSRFFREDIFIALFSLLFVLSLLKYIEKKRGDQNSSLIYLIAVSIIIGIMASTKENTYLLIAIFGSFIAILLIYEKIKKCETYFKEIVNPGLARDVFILSVIVLITFSILYSGSIFNIEEVKNVFIKATGYWFEVHELNRIAAPFYYYFLIMTAYELPIFIFGILGILYYYKKSILWTFISYWVISSFLIYSYFQEKVPWLVLNIILPLTIIAGKYINGLICENKISNIRIKSILLSILFFTSISMVYSSVALNFINFDDASGLLVQDDQPPQDFIKYVTRLHNISQEEGTSAFIQVTDTYLLKSTLAWYLRDHKNIAISGINPALYPSIRLQNDGFDAPMILMDKEDYYRVKNIIDENYNVEFYDKYQRYEIQNLSLGYLISRKLEPSRMANVTVLAYRKNRALENGFVRMKTGFKNAKGSDFRKIEGRINYLQGIHESACNDCYFSIDTDNNGQIDYLFYQYYDWGRPPRNGLEGVVPDDVREKYGEPIMIVMERFDSDADSILDVMRMVYQTKYGFYILDYNNF